MSTYRVEVPVTARAVVTVELDDQGMSPGDAALEAARLVELSASTLWLTGRLRFVGGWEMGQATAQRVAGGAA